MFTEKQTEDILKQIHSMLDEFSECNDSKERTKNVHLKDYANMLRKACVEIGYLRYQILCKVVAEKALK